MPENENIISEADIQPAEEQVPSISFSPVSSTDEEVVIPEEDPKPAEEVIQPEEVIPQVEPTPDSNTEEDYDLVELDAKTAWEFLKKEKGLEVEDFDSLLTPKEQKKYAPELEKFQEFIEKTGNTDYNDYLETQKDWSAESEDVRLKSYIKFSNPALTDKEVNHLFNKRYNIEGLDEDIDEDEITERIINTKTDLSKADAFLEQRKEEFKAVGGSDEHIPLEYREAKKLLEDQSKQDEAFQTKREETRNDFVSKTENLFNSDFEGFKIQLGDSETGFEDFTIKPENLNEIKEFQLDSNNFTNKFFDENGSVKDPKAYHEAMYMANNYKAELNKAYQRGIAKQLEISDKLSKNIQPDNIRPIQQSTSAGITFTIEK